MITNETSEARKTRLRSLLTSMTVIEIAAAEGLSRTRIYQLLGPLHTRDTPSPLLLTVHAYMRAYQREHLYGASIPEIAAAFPTTKGLPRSTSVVSYWLNQMERLRLIEPRGRGARTLVARRLPKSQVIRDMQERDK